MSEFHINVVRVGPVVPHPNADALDIAQVFDYSVIVKKGSYKEGDLAVYIPVDSVVPDAEQWSFLAPSLKVGEVPERYRRIRAKRLRGIFSQGMLAEIPKDGALEGDDVGELMGIKKYEYPVETLLTTRGEQEPGPEGWEIPKYTDVEALRRNPHVLLPGEDVVVTEKIHGANARYVHDGERLWVGSHRQIRRRDDSLSCLWWKAAQIANLEEKLARAPKIVFFWRGFRSGSGLEIRHAWRSKVLRVRPIRHQDAEIFGLQPSDRIVQRA